MFVPGQQKLNRRERGAPVPERRAWVREAWACREEQLSGALGCEPTEVGGIPQHGPACPWWIRPENQDATPF
jgi:hypothetical protein